MEEETGFIEPTEVNKVEFQYFIHLSRKDEYFDLRQNGEIHQPV